MYQRQRIEQASRTHYENFPVASWLLPSRLRAPVRIIYAFARCADDIADEGTLSTDERLDALRAMAQTLVGISEDPDKSKGQGALPWLWPGVAWLLRHHRPPLRYLLDLISAFEQDVRGKLYADQAAVADYTRRSANPIGRLILHLSGHHHQPWLGASDRVCSALQLLNFYQDIGDDLRARNRLYLPADVLLRHNISVPFDERGVFIENRFDWPKLNPALIEMTTQAIAMLAAGRAGLDGIGGRLGLELDLICAAGLRTGKKLLARRDPTRAPRLNAIDRAGLLLQLGKSWIV